LLKAAYPRFFLSFRQNTPVFLENNLTKKLAQRLMIKGNIWDYWIKATAKLGNHLSYVIAGLTRNLFHLPN